MKSKAFLLTLLALLPFATWAHELAVPHTHNGILNGWENVIFYCLALTLVLLLIKISIKRKSHEREV